MSKQVLVIGKTSQLGFSLNKVLNQEYSTLQLNYPLTYKTVEWYIRIYNTIVIQSTRISL